LVSSQRAGAIKTPINIRLLNDPETPGALLKNIPLGRLGQPQDVAALVAFLALPKADHITGSTFFC
jgi:glucose 1-dehydrogenase